MGTLNGALLARQIPTQGLRGEAVDEIEVDDGVLGIRRVRLTALFETRPTIAKR
jgi:hypothetical protein